eukprot:6213539-Amphidinium_carterae.1
MVDSHQPRSLKIMAAPAVGFFAPAVMMAQALATQAFSLHRAASYHAFQLTYGWTGIYGLVLPLVFWFFQQLVKRSPASSKRGLNFSEDVGCDASGILPFSFHVSVGSGGKKPENSTLPSLAAGRGIGAQTSDGQ